MIIGIVSSQIGHPPALPSTIGEAFGGGYYVGDVVVADGGGSDGTYAVIMAPSSGEITAQWKTSNNDTPGTISLTNGLSNTSAMISAGAAAHPAGQHCDNYAGSGFTDWYMPAKDELALAWTNRALLAALAMAGDWYFSSTQASGSNAWGQLFVGGTQTTVGKGETYRVRPSRRLLR